MGVTLAEVYDIAGLPPFRVADAPQHGFDRAALRRHVNSGDLISIRPGVLVGRRRTDLADDSRARHLLAIQAAIAGLRRGSPAAACLGSAAVCHELSRLGKPPERVRLYRERGGHWRDTDLAVLICKLPPTHVTELSGIPVTTRSRTVVDLARWVTFRSGVVVVDSALRQGSSRAELEQIGRDCARWPGIRRARQAVAFGDSGAQTPLESISRVAMAEAGLPAPRLQVPLGADEGGRPAGIVDFLWEEFGVIGESDGLLKYDDPAALRAEKLRQEALEALGYRRSA